MRARHPRGLPRLGSRRRPGRRKPGLTAAWRKHRRAASRRSGRNRNGSLRAGSRQGSGAWGRRKEQEGGALTEAANREGGAGAGGAGPPPPSDPPSGITAGLPPDGSSASANGKKFALLESVRAEAYDEGYRQGLFDGGEARVGRQLPRHMILPELGLDDVIYAGLGALSSLLVRLKSPSEVYDAFDRALLARKPLSLVRLGDGELLTLAHDTVLPAELVKRYGSFLPYAGVHLPDPAAREALAGALRRADVIGVPESRHPFFQGLLFPVLRHYGLNYRTLMMTSSTINYALNEEGWLRRLIAGRGLLLVGNTAPALAERLSGEGFRISGVISPVNGVHDANRVVSQAAGIEFDLALVAAGIAAVSVCVGIAAECGKTALDFGHLADKLVSGEVPLN
ncbi:MULTISPECIES: GT-D fold domain-containing glycosyltransferase [Paenibacillus]|uniref:GT-D fold domain-containing protein n=1 Tax=Paenibacillus TaxID=44249 RepID=UPI002FE151F2